MTQQEAFEVRDKIMALITQNAILNSALRVLKCTKSEEKKYIDRIQNNLKEIEKLENSL